MKIIAGVDGSSRSFRALQFASKLLKPTRDNITLYFSPPRLQFDSSSPVEPNLRTLAETAFVSSVFEQAQRELGPGFSETSVTRIVDNKPPCEGLLVSADADGADLVVIGAHRATRRVPLFLGGSARRIVHDSRLPVLLVREDNGPVLPDAGLRVLFACDHGDLWCAALTTLPDFAWPENTRATLFHVVEMMDEHQMEQFAQYAHAAVTDAQEIVDKYRDTVTEKRNSRCYELEARREHLPEIVRNADPKVVEGHVVDRILEEVRENNVDLVVVGSRQLNAFSRWLGSTTEGLIHLCPCSLLLLRPDEAA